MTQVLIGDTRSLKNIARLKELGWGRMFAGVKPTPYEGEPWGFDNGAFYNWTHGMPFDEARFLYRLKVAWEVGTPAILQRNRLRTAVEIAASQLSTELGTCETTDWPHLTSDGTGKKRAHEKRDSCTNWKRG